MTRPMMPPRASISRTRCPLPIPPIAGLQDICPMRSRLSVSRAVLAPSLAAAAAASQPAWPAPITITSKYSSKIIAALFQESAFKNRFGREKHLLTYRCKRSKRSGRGFLRLSFRRLCLQDRAAHYEVLSGLSPHLHARATVSLMTRWLQSIAPTVHDGAHWLSAILHYERCRSRTASV